MSWREGNHSGYYSARGWSRSVIYLRPQPEGGEKQGEVTGIQKRELSRGSHLERIAVTFSWGEPVRRQPKTLIILSPPLSSFSSPGGRWRVPQSWCPQLGVRGQGRPHMAPYTLINPLKAESSIETGLGWGEKEREGLWHKDRNVFCNCLKTGRLVSWL